MQLCHQATLGVLCEILAPTSQTFFLAPRLLGKIQLYKYLAESSMAHLTVTTTQQRTPLTLVFVVLRLILKSVLLNKTFKLHGMLSFGAKSPKKRILCAECSKCRRSDSCVQRAFKISEIAFAHLKRKYLFLWDNQVVNLSHTYYSIVELF